PLVFGAMAESSPSIRPLSATTLSAALPVRRAIRQTRIPKTIANRTTAHSRLRLCPDAVRDTDLCGGVGSVISSLTVATYICLVHRDTVGEADYHSCSKQKPTCRGR